MKRVIALLLLVTIALPFCTHAGAKDLLGDVDGDNSVGVYDYILTARIYFGTFIASDEAYRAADVNQSGRVDQYDYILLRRHYFGTFEIKGELPPYIPEGALIAELAPDSQNTDDMKANTKALQALVDKASANGGGTVYIPSGTYYFASQGLNRRGNEEYVCMPKDNVTVMGAGEETVLKPVGRSSGGLDMFYFNEYADSGFTNPKYLVNADFRDFTIDSELTNADHYTSAGKGFMINLYKDCDWYNVTVKNTDGTGFGMDCPINCTIINCKAYNCGKRATTANVGASGFGIGTGYCEEETILIDNCYAEGNKKFGVFFEHQGRFCGGRHYTAKGMEGFVVQNCTAKNNYIDFGGELAVDVSFKNCTVPKDSTSSSKIAFSHHSIRCTVEDMNVECLFNDVKNESAPYYDSVYWAVNKGLTTGVGNNLFGVNDGCTKGHALTFLYRLAGCPGELRLVGTGEREFYENALVWANKIGIAEPESEMYTPLTQDKMLEYLWIYSGKPSAEGSNAPHINWALEKGIIENLNQDALTRASAVTVLYKYFEGE